MSARLLKAKAAPKDTILWLQMIQEPNRLENCSGLSDRLHGRLTGTTGRNFRKLMGMRSCGC
jgi:hypothetical protein